MPCFGHFGHFEAQRDHRTEELTMVATVGNWAADSRLWILRTGPGTACKCWKECFYILWFLWTSWTQWSGPPWCLDVAPSSCWFFMNLLVSNKDGRPWGFRCVWRPSFLGSLMASLFIGCCMNGKAGHAKRISVQIMSEQLLRAVPCKCMPITAW